MFERLKGNYEVKGILKLLLAAGRVPNALLFAGADGVGKRQFAIELAKSLVCRESDVEGCDACSACMRAAAFVLPKPDDKDAHKNVIFSEHPDVGAVIPYNRNILVDAVRDLEKEANFLPYEAKARFFIIDDADKMNDAASNALLKTLEEPPPTSHIFLISSRPDSLLPTIRSRCQMLRFSPVPSHEIEEFVKEKQALSKAAAALVSRLSQGSIGTALSTDTTRAQAQRDEMLTVLRSALREKSLEGLLRASEEVNSAKNKDDFEDYLRMLEMLIHDIWKLLLGARDDSITNADIIDQLKHLAENVETRTLSAWLDEIELLREGFIVNINKKIATDALFVRMCIQESGASRPS